jgi:hypothetical protein
MGHLALRLALTCNYVRNDRCMNMKDIKYEWRSVRRSSE